MVAAGDMRDIIIAGSMSTSHEITRAPALRASMLSRLMLLGYAPGTAGSLGIRGLEPEQTEALADRINSSLLQAYYTGQTSTAYGITTILSVCPTVHSSEWL